MGRSSRLRKIDRHSASDALVAPSRHPVCGRRCLREGKEDAVAAAVVVWGWTWAWAWGVGRVGRASEYLCFGAHSLTSSCEIKREHRPPPPPVSVSHANQTPCPPIHRQGAWLRGANVYLRVLPRRRRRKAKHHAPATATDRTKAAAVQVLATRSMPPRCPPGPGPVVLLLLPGFRACADLVLAPPSYVRRRRLHHRAAPLGCAKASPPRDESKI